MHVCYQPLSVNIYIFRNEPNRDVRKLVTRLCLLSGTLLLLRLPGVLLEHLPAGARAWLPGLPDAALAGDANAVCSWEAMCGPRVCASRGAMHLRWELPLTVRHGGVAGVFFSGAGALPFVRGLRFAPGGPCPWRRMLRVALPPPCPPLAAACPPGCACLATHTHTRNHAPPPKN